MRKEKLCAICEKAPRAKSIAYCTPCAREYRKLLRTRNSPIQSDHARANAWDRRHGEQMVEVKTRQDTRNEIEKKLFEWKSKMQGYLKMMEGARYDGQLFRKYQEAQNKVVELKKKAEVLRNTGRYLGIGDQSNEYVNLYK